MNTMIFLGGLGAGALLATVSLLGVIRFAIRKSSKHDREILENNQRSIDALEVRNQISKDQLNAMRDIAAELERHFNQPN